MGRQEKVKPLPAGTKGGDLKEEVALEPRLKTHSPLNMEQRRAYGNSMCRSTEEEPQSASISLVAVCLTGSSSDYFSKVHSKFFLKY